MPLFSKKETVTTDLKRIETVLSRGVDEVIGADKLREQMEKGERLRVKLGIDPTSPHLHLGRSVPLLKMRDFQELGHQAVLIIGDATGVIGDTSDKESERPMLTEDEVEKNKQTYLEQAGKILNITDAEVHHNSEWLNKLTYKDIGEQANEFSVAEFIARDNIKRRLDEGKRVSLREMLYPLMQGYDSVAIEADVELGGVDQRFNLLAGRTLQERYDQKPQSIVMTTFPIEGLDGRKMSSSWGNTVNFLDEPQEMFGKIMRVNDDLIEKYFAVLTRVPEEEIKKVVNKENPKDAKIHLAHEIVSMYHDAQSADEAQEYFIETFSKGVIPKDIPEHTQKQTLQETLVEEGFISSNSQWRRLVDAGAVRNLTTEETIKDYNTTLSKDAVIKIGKKRFVKIVTNT